MCEGSIAIYKIEIKVFVLKVDRSSALTGTLIWTDLEKEWKLIKIREAFEYLHQQKSRIAELN